LIAGPAFQLAFGHKKFLPGTDGTVDLLIDGPNEHQDRDAEGRSEMIKSALI
jgi:hypothetical protein